MTAIVSSQYCKGVTASKTSNLSGLAPTTWHTSSKSHPPVPRTGIFIFWNGERDDVLLIKGDWTQDTLRDEINAGQGYLKGRLEVEEVDPVPRQSCICGSLRS